MGKSQEKVVSVSIIIPHLNEKNMLLDLLDSIEKMTQYDNYIVVVVDNGSQDGSATAVQEHFPKVKIIRNEINLGFAKAINQGIKAFKAKYYFLLNNDTIIIQSGWLTHLVEIMEKNPNLGVLGTKQIQKAFAPDFLRKYEQEGISKEIDFRDFICYGQVLIRSEVFSTVGLLDEDFSPAYVDDLDHCCRILRMGWKLAEIPSIRIIHLECITGNKLMSYKDYLILRHTLLHYIYNLKLPKLITRIGYYYLNVFYRSLHRRKLHFGLYYTPKALFFIFKNLLSIVKKRIRRLQNPSYTAPINFK